MFAYPNQNILFMNTALDLNFNPKALIIGPGCNFGFFPLTYGADVLEGVTGEGAWNAKSSAKAAEFAAKLANEKCQTSFGKAPFISDSYSAELIGSKWQWGKIEPPGIHGYSAEVEFNADGSEQKVRTILHTDGMRIRRKP